jgi:hypothetical protein
MTIKSGMPTPKPTPRPITVKFVLLPIFPAASADDELLGAGAFCAGVEAELEVALSVAIDDVVVEVIVVLCTTISFGL